MATLFSQVLTLIADQSVKPTISICMFLTCDKELPGDVQHWQHLAAGELCDVIKAIHMKLCTPVT